MGPRPLLREALEQEVLVLPALDRPAEIRLTADPSPAGLAVTLAGQVAGTYRPLRLVALTANAGRDDEAAGDDNIEARAARQALGMQRDLEGARHVE